MKELDREFAEFMKNVNTCMGFDDSFGELVALLYIEPETISLEELAKRTRYSLASVSMKMKMMEGMGLVQRIRKPGSKKAYFYMDKDMCKHIRIKADSIYRHRIRPVKEYLPKLIAKYRAKSDTPETRKKLQILSDYLRQLQRIEKVLLLVMKELDKEDK